MTGISSNSLSESRAQLFEYMSQVNKYKVMEPQDLKALNNAFNNHLNEYHMKLTNSYTAKQGKKDILDNFINKIEQIFDPSQLEEAITTFKMGGEYATLSQVNTVSMNKLLGKQGGAITEFEKICEQARERLNVEKLEESPQIRLK